MTLRHLKIFVTVADCNSITGAANKLYLAQPAVSLAIRELEQHYGVRLFERLSHRISITPDGRRMYAYASHILDTMGQLEKDMHNPDGLGLLRVGCSITIGTRLLPALVSRYRAENPGMQLEAQIFSSELIEQLLLQGRIDLGLIEGRCTSDELESHSFMRDRLAVVCAPNNGFADQKVITPLQLFSSPLLLRERGSGTRELLEAAAVVRGYTLCPLWESTSTQALIAGVAEGHGLSVLPYLLVKQLLDSGNLCELTVEGMTLERELLLLRHKNKFVTPGMKAFADEVNKIFLCECPTSSKAAQISSCKKAD